MSWVRIFAGSCERRANKLAYAITIRYADTLNQGIIITSILNRRKEVNTLPAYKDEQRGTWYSKFYYQTWDGERKQKKKRGFRTRREAVEFE